MPCFLRHLGLALALVLPLAAPAIQVRPIPSPAAPGALAPTLAADPDGALWMAWVEPPGSSGSGASAGRTVLKIARYSAESKPWTGATTVSADAVAASSADIPQLVAQSNNRLTVAWMDGSGAARVSRSEDGGTSWSAPRSLVESSAAIEMLSLAPLADGRILAAWLDGRGYAADKRQRLYTRFVDARGADERLVDGSVCDCCQTALAPLLDGGALLAYRGRTEHEVRDIHVARLHDGSWGTPAVAAPDGWRVPACPVNGPRLACDGSRAALVWFTAADRDPRVLVSFTPDAGARWLMPLRLDRGKPAGHGDVQLLRDGAIVAVWLEEDGSLWLRRISPEYVAGQPVEIVPAGEASLRGFPRLALQRDYEGGAGDAAFILAYTAAGAEGGVKTVEVTVPEGTLISRERNCDCAPSAEQLRGFGVRARILNVDVASRRARIDHDAVPGVLRAGQRDVTVDPAVAVTLTPGSTVIGRVERERGGTWRLFALQRLGEAAGDGR